MVQPLTDLHFAFLSEGLKRPHATFEADELAAFLGVSDRDKRDVLDRLWKMKALHSDFEGIFIVTQFGRELLERRNTQQHINEMIEFGRDQKPPDLTIDPDAFVMRVNAVNPSLPKWGRLAFEGQVIRRADFRHPGISLDDWFQRDMIRHATADEVEAFDRRFGEKPDVTRQRNTKIEAFRADVRKRIEVAKKPSEPAALFLTLMKEWQDSDSRCRHLWHHEPGVLPVVSEDYIRDSLMIERALAEPVERGDILARGIKVLAEPLMRKAEGYEFDTKPFRDFFLTMERQDKHPDVHRYAALDELVQRLRLRLEHDEEEDLKRQRAEFEASGQKPLRITEFVKHYKPPQVQQPPTVHTFYIPTPRSQDAESKPKKISEHNWYEVSRHPILVAAVIGIATACGWGIKALWTHFTAPSQSAAVAQTTPAAPNQVPTSQASAVNPPAGTPTPAYQTEEILQEVTVEVGSRNYPAGDDGRASPDFFTPFDKRTKWVILLPAPEVDTLVFDVVFEKSPAGFVGGKTDRTGIIRNVRNGAVISGLKGDLTYIANVRGNRGPFKVQIIKAE